MEITRNPKTPIFNKRSIELLTELVFRKNNEPRPVDGIFVFSTSLATHETARIIERLLKDNISSQLFLTGGMPASGITSDTGTPIHKTEADLVYHDINPNILRGIRVYQEHTSTNTLTNVTESLQHSPLAQCQSVLFIFKSHAAGRGFLTLRKFLPNATLIQQTFDTKYPKAPKKITRDNWHTFTFGSGRVWGEFLRIRTYGSRGDIAYDEVRELTSAIEKATT